MGGRSGQWDAAGPARGGAGARDGGGHGGAGRRRRRRGGGGSGGRSLQHRPPVWRAGPSRVGLGLGCRAGPGAAGRAGGSSPASIPGRACGGTGPVPACRAGAAPGWDPVKRGQAVSWRGPPSDNLGFFRVSSSCARGPAVHPGAGEAAPRPGGAAPKPFWPLLKADALREPVRGPGGSARAQPCEGQAPPAGTPQPPAAPSRPGPAGHGWLRRLGTHRQQELQHRLCSGSSGR